MKRYFIPAMLIMVIGFGFNSCKTLMSYTNIINCDFRMKSLTDTQVSGISVENLNSVKELSLLQAGKLAKAYVDGNIPLSFNLNLEAKNPNSSAASLSKFDWILLIDDIEMVNGTSNNQYSIPGNNGTTTIPLNISINLMEVLKGKSRDALLNFGFNLADASNKPTRVQLKLRPTVYLNQTIPLSYPNYITLGTEFGGN